MTGILLDEHQQFSTRRGDFIVTADTDAQDETEILYANKGNFIVSAPTLGVGITDYLNSPMHKPDLERTIRKEFEKDNINVVSVSVSNVDDTFKVKLTTSRNEQ